MVTKTVKSTTFSPQKQNGTVDVRRVEWNTLFIYYGSLLNTPKKQNTLLALAENYGAIWLTTLRNVTLFATTMYFQIPNAPLYCII